MQQPFKQALSRVIFAHEKQPVTQPTPRTQVSYLQRLWAANPHLGPTDQFIRLAETDRHGTRVMHLWHVEEERIANDLMTIVKEHA